MKFKTVLIYTVFISVFLLSNALAEVTAPTEGHEPSDGELMEVTTDEQPPSTEPSITEPSITGPSVEGGGASVLPVPFEIHASKEAYDDTATARRIIMESLSSSLNRGVREGQSVEIKGIEALRVRYNEAGEAAFAYTRALETARKEGVGFLIMGSITRLGNSLNLTWRIIDVGSGDAIAFHSLNGESEEALSSNLTTAGAAMREEILTAIDERPVSKEGVLKEVLIEGNRRVGAMAIKKKLKTGSGSAFSTDDLREDIHTIYNMGYFTDVTVELLNRRGALVVIFKVKEKPFINSVSIEGNKDVKNSPIEEVITVKPSTLIDRSIIKGDAERIRNLYTQRGYYMASVTPRIAIEGSGASVTFEIDEGKKVKVRRIAIKGNNAFSKRKIRKLMETKKAGLFSFISNSGNFDQYLFEDDMERLKDLYYNNGYVEFRVLDHRVLLSDDKRWFDITIKVEEGKRYRLGEISFIGDSLFTDKKLLKTLGMKEGRVFKSSDLIEGLDALRYLYGDEGFAYAEVRPSTTLNPEEQTLDLSVNINKQEAVYIERIDMHGNSRTRDKVIRRELELGEGDLFSATKLKHSRNNLRRLGYFEDLRINKSTGTTPSKMLLDVDVVERPTGAVTFGLGYSSVDKMTTTASISQSNLLGTGLKLNASGNISSSSSRYMINFTEPWLFGKSLSAGIDLYKTTRDYEDFSMETDGFGLRFGFPLYKRTTRGYLSYRYEEVTVDNVDPAATLTIQEQAGVSKSSSLKALIHHDSRDNFFFPSEGSVVKLSSELAGGALGGTNSYLKHEVSMKKLFPLAKHLTFSLKGSAGYMHGFDGKEVPLYERYYMGGINSIRGLRSRSVSPEDSVTGELIGGLSNALFSAELVFPLFPEEKMMGVIFYDRGNSYEKDIQLNDMRSSAGGGIRWFSPMGPLRLEWGYNLDKRLGERESLWEFTIGGLF